MKKSVLALIFASVMAPKAMADDVYNVPFVDDFDKNTKREQYTTIDANHDGVTWKRHYQTSLLPGWYPDVDYHEMEYGSSAASQPADDWFITPKIHFEEGKVYSISFDTYVSFDSFTHQLEVKMGQGVTAEAMTTQLMKQQTVSYSSKVKLEQEFAVDEDGDYNIGFHVLSQPDRGSLYFGNLVIKQLSNDGTPAKITDLIITPDAAGKLKAEVTFTAPSLSVQGAALTSLTKVELSRDGKLITTLTDVKPGLAVSYTDNTPHNGFNSYTAIAYNEQGKGIRTVVDSVYVGVDIPLPPTDFKVTDMGNEVIFSWGKVPAKGTRGFVVDADDVTYILDALNDSYEYRSNLTETKSNSYRYVISGQDGGQDLQRFGVRAYNAAGWGDYAYVRILVGVPYNLPYRESFATGAGHGIIWQEGIGTYYVTTEESADGDAGCVQFTSGKYSREVSFNLGKMNMRLAQHPVMSFQYKGLMGDDAIIVYAERQDGTKVELATLKGDAADWTTTTVDFGQFVGESYIIPKLMTKADAGHTISLDDFQILDLYEADLDVALAAEVGESGMIEAEVIVSNMGVTDAENFDVVLSMDGKEAKRITVTEPLKAGFQTIVKAELPMEVVADEQVELKAQVQWLYDLNADNDQATMQVVADKKALNGNDNATLIAMLKAAGERGLDVYTPEGQLVMRGAKSVEGLKKGIYIIGGKKVCVTR
ncbi:MAG: fibronectin type III domain-containing protein [Bacteroidales bacterium]|nr:fibronectin type III domain-containing protein [Bacteroidales bacterium]